jgi:hypothetical protein
MGRTAEQMLDVLCDALRKPKGNVVIQCPLCELWDWNNPNEWNEYKGCCADCAELDG